MSSWKQRIPKPAGALPGGLVTKLGIGLGTVLVLALVLSVGSGEEDDPAGAPAPAPPQAPAPGGSVEPQLQTQVDRERQRQQQAAAALAAEEARARAAALLAAGSGDAPPPAVDPVTGEIEDPEETQIRRTFRLESLDRRLRSLRAEPVALSFRDASRGGGGPAAGAIAAPAATTAPASADPMTDLLQALQDPGALPPSETPAPGTLDVPLPNSGDLPDYANPPRLVTPDDPAGWERVYEGSFLEAVLVNQLDGEFPSPVLAMVAVPFRSADRLRVLIPRGSRLIGTAQAVAGRDQSRLAVGFHRLILPDGRYVALHFQGLNQIGEGALRDQVDRHFWSTFFAAGAVGLLSGLSFRADPYSPQAAIGAGMAQTSMQILEPYLNRLPTITIRAGHRLRVWFTNDVLVPRSYHTGGLP